MKKISVFLWILFLFGIVTLSTIAQTTEFEKGYISVNESISKEISPNQAEISISIETFDKSLKKASEDNKTIANKVYSTLKILLGKDDYIKTGNYSIQPQYIYSKENKRVLDTYMVSNSVTIKTKNIELVSKLIDTATAQGATKIDNLQFSAADYDSNCDVVLVELAKKAYSKANSIAKSINSQIIGIKSINATCNLENARPYYGSVMMMKNAMDSASATPIESGKIKIYVNIDSSFYVSK